MIEAISYSSDPKHRGILASVLSPPLQVRFAIALLLTFFPYGILYPLEYPAGELVTLGCWVWVFPSPIGFLTFALLPFVPGSAYGYFAFNTFCLVASLAIAMSAIRCREFRADTVVQIYKFARVCIFLTIAICLLQVTLGPDMWVSVFPEMRLGDGGRGAGLRLEPSLLVGPLSLYLLFLFGRIGAGRALSEQLKVRKSLVQEGIWVVLSLLILTRSISILTIAICFLPALPRSRRRILLPVLAAGAGLGVAILAFGERITQALKSASGSAADLVTVSIGSWRNIPDLLIISNYRDFLLPGNPAEIRAKINRFAILMDPGFAWIQNTYSTFAAGASTAGLLAVGILFVGGLCVGLRLLSRSAPMRLTWVMLYLSNWFLTPKYEAAGWVVVGLLPLADRFNESKSGESLTAWRKHIES